MSACVGISPADRDLSPFERVADIVSVEPLTEEVGTAKIKRTETVGAVVTFRAVPGLTAEWLQRIIDCHVARNAALGHVVPEMPNCPLVPRGVHARVRSVGNGFAVEIRGDNEVAVNEIRARSQRLNPRAQTASRGSLPPPGE
jgi:hypothetical protein